MHIIDKLKTLFAKKEPANILGISLCQNSIVYCYLVQGETPKWQNLPLIEGSYSKTLASLSQQHQLTAQVAIVLPAKLSQSVQVEKPNVPAEEINAALKWLVKDLVSISPEDMVLDYYDAPKLIGGVDKINVVCAPFTEVNSLIPALINDKMALKHITIEEFAFANLVPVQDDACLLVCQQTDEEVVLLVVKNGQLFFNRRLRGFSHLAQKTTQELEMGIIDSLSIEIQRSTDYFERQLKQAPIKSIEVIVPIENEAFLARKLSENTNVPVNLLALPEGYEQAREFAVAIGAQKLCHPQEPELSEESVTEEGLVHE